jgi:ring-1,2-phenylacetyl-CoA epoxidase subunit PaaE
MDWQKYYVKLIILKFIAKMHFYTFFYHLLYIIFTLYLLLMSVPKFHALQIKDIRVETNDTVSIALAVPTELLADYTYEPGQYLTFKKEIDGQELRRSYSLCSAPHQNEWRVAVKQVYEGKFSTYINQHLKIGDMLDTMTPMGHFTTHASAEGKNYMGFASGSGITPIMSILKAVLQSNNANTFTLVYGNKNVASIIFKEEIESLKNIYIGRLQVVHVLSRERMDVELNYGRIDTEKCAQLFSRLIDINTIQEAFICGPEQMTLQVKDYLVANGMPAKNVKFELFGTGAGNAAKLKINNEPQSDLGPISRVSIKVDERTFEIDLAYNGENILDAALRNGADLPFACKGGVCCTCRAKITEGTVKMTVNYALEKEEVEQGFVLSCQAHPTSPHVTIDFDVR